MPSKLVELRPDRKLLDPNFEGYKLSLQAIPHWEFNLEDNVDRLQPDESQYSFAHAKLFSLHNYLTPDVWDHRYSYFYITSKNEIRRLNFDNESNHMKRDIVFAIPHLVERKPGHFYASLSFPSSDFAFISDGAGNLHLATTEARGSSNQRWVNVYSEQILGDDNYFVILDSRKDIDSENTFQCLLQSVVQIEQVSYSLLSWITLKYIENNWCMVSLKQVQGKGSIHYAAIETSCTALYVAADEEFKYIADSDKKIEENKEPVRPEIFYSWLQTNDDITVTCQLPIDFKKELLHINIGFNNVKISYAGKIFVEGKLSDKIDHELTTWNVDPSGKVDILVTKTDQGLWQQFLEGGDPHGEQILDPSSVAEVHERLAHLCSETLVVPEEDRPVFNSQELEECDTVSDADTVLARLEVKEHTQTHRVPLSVQQFLFSVQVDPHEVPALALRNDVDACIWQPYSQVFNNDTWPVKHLGTLMAFGYVQSSKQNRKFVTCPPNFEYSVVCEAKKHLFLYASKDDGCELRKRTASGDSKKVQVGQQQVFNLDKHGEVLGIHATNTYLFILAESTFLVLEINKP